MNAIVKHVSDEIELRFGKFKGRPGKTIFMKDTSTGEEVKCYLPLEFESASFWLRDSEPGNILEGLSLNQKGGIDWTKPYTNVVKPLENEKLL